MRAFRNPLKKQNERTPFGVRSFQTVDKVYFFDLCCKSLAEFRRPADGGRGSNRVFRRRVRRKTHFPGRKCANREPKQSPAKRVCLGEKGQGSGVNPGRQAGANGADFDPTKCAQRPASPRKNACIFEKRVEVFRHADRGPACSAGPLFSGRHLPACLFRCLLMGHKQECGRLWAARAGI